jgi:hypothetical protein
VHFTQWTGQVAARAFTRSDKSLWASAVDDAVPGIARLKVTAYRRYRSTTALTAPPPTGCLVTVTVDFDGPDPRRQRAWVDNTFAAAGTVDPSPDAGMLAAHFHVSLDGTRVLNLAEWTSAQAHRDALAMPAPPFRARVRAFPGVISSVAQRYLSYQHATASMP